MGSEQTSPKVTQTTARHPQSGHWHWPHRVATAAAWNVTSDGREPSLNHITFLLNTLGNGQSSGPASGEDLHRPDNLGLIQRRIAETKRLRCGSLQGEACSGQKREPCGLRAFRPAFA